MNNITFYELVSFAKVFSKAFAIDRRMSVTKEEEKAAIEVLKKINENRADWTQEQKETYKAFADLAKEMVDNSDAN